MEGERDDRVFPVDVFDDAVNGLVDVDTIGIDDEDVATFAAGGDADALCFFNRGVISADSPTDNDAECFFLDGDDGGRFFCVNLGDPTIFSMNRLGFFRIQQPSCLC